MDIFPELIGEKEFEYFNAATYTALSEILNDTLAKYLKDYITNPAANVEIVSDIQKYLGEQVESLTFHYVLQDRGIIDLVGHLTPETLIKSDVNREEIKNQLLFLESNINKLRTVIPARTKKAYEAFMSCLSGTLETMRSEGIQPTYPNIIKRIESNKFVFYTPNDKGHTTGSNIINSRRKQWIMCLRGLQYTEYCDANGINYLKRRVF